MRLSTYTEIFPSQVNHYKKYIIHVLQFTEFLAYKQNADTTETVTFMVIGLHVNIYMYPCLEALEFYGRSAIK
jgi:hypothetical protein